MSGRFLIVWHYSNPINLWGIIIYDNNDINISSDKIAYSSSIYVGGGSNTFGPEKVLEQTYNDTSLFSTDNTGNNHFIIIDLGVTYNNINRIYIRNRVINGYEHEATQRISGATVALLNESFANIITTSSTHNGNLPETITSTDISTYATYSSTYIYNSDTYVQNTFYPPPPPTLNLFTITPTDITIENHGTINMTFSNDAITQTDISNSLTVDPSNVGIITNITDSGTDWSANFVPNYGVDSSDCILKFKHDGYGIDTSSNTFTIETYIQQIKSVSLTPENIITDLSSNLEVILRVPTGDIAPTILIDPSYIADLDGNMTSSDGGLTWNGTINRTLGMNLLGNTLTVTSGDLSSNIVFDAYDEQYLIYDVFNNTEIADISVNNMRLSGNGEYALVYDQPKQKTFIYSYSSNDNNWVSNHNIHHSSLPSYHMMTLLDIAETNRFIVGGDAQWESKAYLYDYNTTDGETLIKTFDVTHSSQHNYQMNGKYNYASLSYDGNVVALGNTQYDGYVDTGHTNHGIITVFEISDGTWTQKGTDIIGVNSQSLGKNIQISGNGNVIRTIVGNSYKTYYYVSEDWENKTNSQIINRYSVMNYDGTIYAVNNKIPSTNNFLVEIYDYNSTSDSSVKTGDFKFSEHTYFSGYLNLSMSSNGDIVAVGYTSYNNNRGITLLYKNNGTSWEKIYSIEGTIDDEQYGSEVILSNDGKTLMTKNNNNECRIIKLEQTIGRFLSSQITLDPSNIEYPNTTSNFQINFTTNDKTFDDISGNVSLTSSVSNIDTSSLALTNYGFRLEGNIVADPYSESVANKITYFETVDISGESANFTINTVPEFELLGCTLTPENLVDTDVSATLRIEFNIPITGSSPNFNFTLDPSYIATLGPMSDVSSGFVWEGVLTRTPNMNKLDNKLDFDFSYNGVEVSANLVYDVVEDSSYLDNDNLIHKATSITLDPSNLLYPDTSANFAIQFTTNDVSLTTIQNNLSVDPSNVANITNTSLTNYGFTLEGQIDASGEHNVSGVKLFYEDFSSNAFDIYSIQDLSINEFSFNISSAVTYENYSTNNITLTLNRSDLTNVDISNSLQISPSSCGQIGGVSGTGYTRTISFTPTFYILESNCSLTFHYTRTDPYLDASMTILFSVDTEQKIMDASLNPQSIFEPNNASNFGVKFRLPVETPGTAPDITISPSYIANIVYNPVISNDTWTGTIHRSQNKNLLYNVIDFSYNGFDTSLNFNVAQNPELIVGPREIDDFVECNGIKITSVSSTEAFTVSEVQITDYDTNTYLVSTDALYEISQSSPQNGTPSNIMDSNSGTSCTIDASSNSFFNIKFTPTSTPIKIKEITIYASHSVKIELLGEAPNYNTITNLGQVNVDVSGTINIANASTQSTITRAVTNIALDPSNIVYPDVSSNFEMLFSTNTVSLSDISNIYLSIDPSNAANLTNLSLIEDGFKLEGKIEANEKIFEEDCKLKYDETIDISGEKQLAIKDLFVSSSSIVPKSPKAFLINFEHNVGELELVFTLEKSDLSLNDFVLDNSASISNLIKDGLKWKADITFPNTDSDVSVNYNIVVNYKSGDSYPISKTYNTYVPNVGNEVSVLDIYDKVPDPVAGFDISLNRDTILTSGTPSQRRSKREVFIERLLDTYKDNLKTTTDKLVMKTEELLGANSGITKEKIKIIDNFDTNGNKLTDISFNTQSLSGDEALYVPLDVGYSIILDTYSSKLKVEKVSDNSFNVYENYDVSNPIITKVMTYDEIGIYDFFQYKIGTVEGENLPAITDISLNPSNIITDLSSNLQVTFSQPASQPIITIDPSYIAYLDGSMTMVDSSGYIWSGTINRTLEMNRLNNILTVSGEHHTSSISFNVVENPNYIDGNNELIRIVKPFITPSDIIYPDTSSNFELLFTTNEKSLDDISGNIQLDPSDVGNLTNLQLVHSGFKLVGNIEAPDLTKNKDTKLKYFETVDVSGESNPFTVYTYPPFQLVNFGLTPENIVGPNDVSSNLQIEFNIPISSDTSLNNSITIDPSYIVNLDNMTTSDNGYTWSGTLTREPYMNKLGNKLEFNYTDNNLSDLNDNAFTASAELLFDVLESKNVLKWEKKTDTSLNEIFNETVEISPNGQILAQISGSNAKIYHLQSDSTWGNVKTYSSANHLALCDNRIAIATSSGVDVYEYDSSNWLPIGSSISESNVSNLDISIDGNRVAYVYDASVGIQEYSSDSGSWSSMLIVVPITGNSVKFSPNGSLLGIGTLDSENQNFSNVVLYEYSEGSGWNLKP